MGLFMVAIVCVTMAVAVATATEVPGELSMEAAFQGNCCGTAVGFCVCVFFYCAVQFTEVESNPQ